MGAAPQTLSVYKGDDHTWTLTFTDSAGDAIDITSSTVTLTVKTNKTDATAQIANNATLTDPTNGICTISVSNSDTNISAGEYFFDIRYTTSGGVVTTVLYGIFRVVQNVG